MTVNLALSNSLLLPFLKFVVIATMAWPVASRRAQLKCFNRESCFKTQFDLVVVPNTSLGRIFLVGPEIEGTRLVISRVPDPGRYDQLCSEIYTGNCN